MTNQELCTQYELLLALLETGNSDKAVSILKDAVSRLKGEDKLHPNRIKASNSCHTHHL